MAQNFVSMPEAIEIGGITIPPGHQVRVEIPITRLPNQTAIALPVTAINGTVAGPRLWLSAALHGDEINGIEIIRQVLARISPSSLRGTLIAVPIVNVFGFIQQSRYLPDGRDLNRAFPGKALGSLAYRLAHLFMSEVASKCSHGIDLHTAPRHRTNLPHIRADLHDPETYRCAKAFGVPVIIDGKTPKGSLREAANLRGIRVLVYEGGEALRFDAAVIKVGVEGILRVMATLDMHPPLVDNNPVTLVEVAKTKWLRARCSGMLHLDVTLGQQVYKKQRLAVISDALGEMNVNVYSPRDGLVIGHTQNPLVYQGDSIFHLGLLKAYRASAPDTPTTAAIASL